MRKNKQFPIRYKVFEYFKDRGMVVRTGMNFGVDYAVYRDSPLRCHAELCVLVADALSLYPPDGAVGVEGTEKSEIGAGAGAGSSSSGSGTSGISRPAVSNGLLHGDALSWRHLSTLTRLVPVS